MILELVSIITPMRIDLVNFYFCLLIRVFNQSSDAKYPKKKEKVVGALGILERFTVSASKRLIRR